MALFFLIFFSVWGLSNYYVLRRTLDGLVNAPEKVRIAVTIFFIIAALSYVLSKAVLVKTGGVVYDIFLWIGSLWFAVILYGFLASLLYDISRLILYLTGISAPKIFTPGTVLGVCSAIVFSIMLYGSINAGTVKLKTIPLQLSARGGNTGSLKVLFFSDSHLTPVNNGRVINQIINLAEETKPDIILMAGDVVDDKSQHLYRYGIDKKLMKLSTVAPVYMCPGNHEYITGSDDAFSFLEKCNITVLRDSAIVFKDIIQIIGRDDSSKFGFSGKHRLPFSELAAKKIDTIPSILLDHQPFRLAETQKYGFDLQLSGHTHHGQLFPANLITSMIYEVSWGMKKKGNSIIYVSSGAGTWGPPVRTGSDAEVILFNLEIQ